MFGRDREYVRPFNPGKFSESGHLDAVGNLDPALMALDCQL